MDNKQQVDRRIYHTDHHRTISPLCKNTIDTTIDQYDRYKLRYSIIHYRLYQSINQSISMSMNGSSASATNTTIGSTIDRITSQALAASSSKQDYIPASTWQGSKSGYYFGTSQQGTGYYIDATTTSTTSSSSIQTSSNRKRQRDATDNNNSNNNNNHNDDDEDNKERKRKVRFGKDEIKFISPKPQKQNAQQLLHAAEQRQASLAASTGSNTRTLDLSRERGPTSLKAFIQNLTKSIAKNELLRIDFKQEPDKFMESEVALYEDIVVLQDLATNAEYYRSFVELGAVDQLLPLLGHTNTDVALAVIRLFVELLDPALFTASMNGVNMNASDNDLDKDSYDDHVNAVLGISALIKAFVGTGDGSNGGVGLVIENLARLKDGEEEEMKGIDDVLTLMENLMDLDQLGALEIETAKSEDDDDDDDDGDENDGQDPYVSVASVICQSTSFVAFLMKKLGHGNSQEWKIGAKLHASELLAAILQHEASQTHIANLSSLPPMNAATDVDANVDSKKPAASKPKSKPTPVDGIECLLQCIAGFRKTDPLSEEECEYLENIFDALTASLLNEKNVEEFLERQGVELMLRCINEGMHAGFGALKVLYFAVSGSGSGSASGSSSFYKRAAETLVDAGGFKSLFSIFMGRKGSFPKPCPNCDAGNLSLLRKYADLQKNGNGNSSDAKKQKSKKMKQVVAASREWHTTTEANSIQILYGLTRHLDDKSPHDAKARLLAKFIENDGEKCDRMIELCLKYDAKMRQAEYLYFKSDEAEYAEANGINVDLAALNAKLAGGGELFHRISAIIAFAAAGSKRCHEYLIEQLRTHNSGIGLVKAGCEEFISILDEGEHRNQLSKYLEDI